MGNRGLTLLVIVLLSVSSLALVLDSDGPGTTVQDNIAEKNFEDLPLNLEPNTLVPRVSGAFLENKGQLENELILYYAAGDPMSVGFGTGVVQYVQHGADTVGGNVVTITFPGANPARPIGTEVLSHPTSFFYGQDPTGWVSGARSFNLVTYPDLWDGIDLLYRLEGNSLKYEFIVRPGADPGIIAMDYEGATDLDIDPTTGDLLVHSPIATFSDSAPWTFQSVTGTTRTVSSEFHLVDGTTVTFGLGPYDTSLPLVIDPDMAWSTYIGGSGVDGVWAHDIDPSGNVYVTGWTASNDWPATSGAYCETNEGLNDIFVAKIASNGTSLLYATYIGGTNGEWARGIAVDSNGSAYIAGYSLSTDYPVTVGANQTTKSTSNDCVVTKLNVNGTGLVYSTYVGGTTPDVAFDIEVDSSGAAYVGGYTEAGFPTTSGAFDESFNTKSDGMIFKLSPDGSTLVYSTYIGGSWTDYIYGIAIDDNGNCYATGFTGSADTSFPVTGGSFCDTKATGDDAFVLKLNASGSGLYWCGFINDGSNAGGGGYAVDVSSDGGTVVVVGDTTVSTLPMNNQSYDDTMNGTRDGWVAMIYSGNSTYISYLSYLGGKVADYPYDVQYGGSGKVHIVGKTSSSDFPTTQDAYDSSYNSGYDVFYTVMDCYRKRLDYSTFIGGADDDEAWQVRVDSSRTVTISGITEDGTFPTTNGAYCTTRTGNWEGFALELVGDTSGPVIGPDNTPKTASMGARLTFNVTISDESGVSNASVEYWQGTGRHYIRSLSRATGDAMNGTWQRNIYPSGSTLDYIFHATDVDGNSNQTTVSRITLTDETPPYINDNTRWFGVATTGDPFRFVANVSDSTGVDEVRIHYTIGTPAFIDINTTMDPMSTSSNGNGMYVLNLTLPENYTGVLPYTMMATDTLGYTRYHPNVAGNGTVIVTDNDRPELGPDMSDTVATTGEPIMLQINVSDNMGVAQINIKYWYGTSAVINMTMNPGTVDAGGNGTYSIMVTLPAHFVGTFNYLINAVDNSNLWNSTSTVQIEAMDDDPPTVGPDGSHPLGDDKFVFEVNVSDNVGVVDVWVVYQFDEMVPLNVSMDPITIDGRGNGTYGNEEVSVPIDQQVAIYYTLYAIDGAGNIRSLDGSYVNFDYEFPEFGDEGMNGEPVKGWNIELWVEVTDNIEVEDVRLEYWFGSGSHENVSMVDLVSTWNLTIELPRHPDGDLMYRFHAVDIKGNWNNTEIWTVGLINKVPDISASPLWEVTEGQMDVLDLEPYLVDLNDLRVDLSLSTGAPGVTVDRLRLMVEYDEWQANHSIEVNVTDGEDTTMFTIQITVINVNDDPVITSEPGTTVEVGSLYEYIVTYTDVDPVDIHTFILDTAPVGMVIAESGRITWTPTEAQIGPHTIDLALSDGWTYVHQIWTITVTDQVNGPPAFTNHPSTTHSAGTTYTWDAAAVDPDGDALTFELRTGPMEATLDAATGQLIWEPVADKRDTSENVDFVMTVTDGELTGEISWTVVLSYPANEPPVITEGLDKVKVSEQNTIDLAQYMSDPDDPTEDLYWDYDENSDLFGADISGSTLTIIPKPEAKGTGKITLELYDPWGMVDTFDLTIEVDTKDASTESESCWSFWWILLIVLAAVIVLLYMSQDKWRPKKEPEAMEEPELAPAMEDEA